MTTFDVEYSSQVNVKNYINMHFLYGMAFKLSRDATILIVLLWFNIMQYSSLFQYFYQSAIVPTQIETMIPNSL